VANHKSAVKAHRQDIKRRERNRQQRTQLRTVLKSIRATLGSGDTGAAKTEFRSAVSLIDKMAGKGIVHNNTADRYKSRLAKQLANLSTSA
jgi:small subunit ribosomal protein S20